MHIGASGNCGLERNVARPIQPVSGRRKACLCTQKVELFTRYISRALYSLELLIVMQPWKRIEITIKSVRAAIENP